MLVADARSRADVLETRLVEIGADPIFGLQVSMGIVAPMVALLDARWPRRWCEKFHGIGRHFRQLAERQREGLAAGRFPTAFAVADTVAQIDGLLATPVADDPLLRTATPPSGIDVDGWKARLRAAVADEVRPGMEAYRDVLRDEVLPQARPDDRPGLTHLAGGDAAYAAQLRYFTTTEQVGPGDPRHRPGPDREARPMSTAPWAPKWSAPTTSTRSSRRCVPTRRCTTNTPRSWSRALGPRWPAPRPRCRDWSEVLPQASCAVEAHESGPRLYFPPAPDGSRGGTFFVNASDPSALGPLRARGDGLPRGRARPPPAARDRGRADRWSQSSASSISNSAYCEGWGLYAERLADEMGLYSSAMDRMGMFSADSLRACRLVVDTGLHAFGWSRRRAIDFMVANSPLTEGICRPEIDRYVVQPGSGHVIHDRPPGDPADPRRGRGSGRASGFEVREFHSAVLDNGSLPLGVLDEVVRARLA